MDRSRFRAASVTALVFAIAFLAAVPRPAVAVPESCKQTDRHMKVFGTDIPNTAECFTLKDIGNFGSALQKGGFGSTDPKKMLDFTFGVVGMAFPAAGPALGIAKMGLDALGVFDAPDPMEILTGRVDQLEKQMSSLQVSVKELQSQFVSAVNSLQFNDMSFLRGVMARCNEVLRPSSIVWGGKTTATTREIAGCRAELQADMDILTHLDDNGAPNMWMSNTFHVKYDPVTKMHLGLVLPPKFRPLPALPVYQMGLVLWMAAVELEMQGDPVRISRTFGAQIGKHRDFLQYQLASDIGKLVSCTIRLSSVYPIGGACRVEDACWDTVRGESLIFPRPQDSFTSKFNSGGRCDHEFFPGDYERFSEDRLESDLGMAVVNELLAALERLKTTGTIKEREQPRFSCSSTSANYLYTIDGSGVLGWRMHEITSQCPGDAKPWRDTTTRYKGRESMRQAVVTPWQQSASGRAVAVESKSTATSGAVTSKGTGGIASVRNSEMVRQGTAQESATAKFYSPDISPELITVKAIAVESDRAISHQLRATKSLGGRWNSFRQVLPGGSVKVATNKAAFVIYGLTPEGQLKWYRHDGSGDGTPAFKGPLDVPVPWNWNSYAKLIPASEGVIYGVTPEGQLVWHRHMDMLNGGPRWQGPRTVASGYGNYQQIFSSGQGVLYAVSGNDLLMWQRHLGYLDGTPTWAKSVPVDSGWLQFRRVFSPGSGQLYALTHDGTLLMATHFGFLTGENKWTLAARVANGFDTTTTVFPLTWGDPALLEVR